MLVILTDQFRADCLGIAGNPDVATPQLDSLAKDGIRYSASYCTAPLCTPSRYSLLTGYLPHQHGVHDNNHGLPGDLWTLPERARAAGCRTSAVGKMHLSPTYMDTGFDTMLLAEQNGDGRLVDDYHADLLAAGLVDGIDLIDQHANYRARANSDYWSSFGARASDLPEQWHSTTWIGDRGIDLIDDQWCAGGQLMYLSFIKPHHPFDPPHPWDQMYEPEALTILPGWTAQPTDPPVRFFDDNTLTEKSLRRIMALYYASISQIDFQVGRIVARLRAIGAYQNTMIIFTADHGEYLGYHHLLLKGGPMYEPLVRVPLIIKPTGEPAGRVDHRLASGMDVVPTALSALGLPIAEDLPGEDLLSETRRDAVIAEYCSDSFMIRRGHHKLLVGPDHQLIYDLAADPLELAPQDLAIRREDDWPAAARSMAADLELVLTKKAVREAHREPSRGSIGRGPQQATPLPTDRLKRFDELLSGGHPWLDKCRQTAIRRGEAEGQDTKSGLSADQADIL